MTKADLHEFEAVHVVFLAAPISELRGLARELGDHISGRHVVIHTCHNLEPTTLATGSQILEEETPTHRFGFLTGPMRAEDLNLGHPASGICASPLGEVFELAEEALVCPKFRLYRNTDLRGSELAAAYARIIALAAGVTDAMGLGRSVQATLFARGLAETARFVESRGGTARAAFGLAGCANLHLDTTTPGSDEFNIGKQVVQKGGYSASALSKQFKQSAPDLVALVESVWDVVKDGRIDTHILETCHLILDGGYTPADALVHLMSLPTLDE